MTKNRHDLVELRKSKTIRKKNIIYIVQLSHTYFCFELPSVLLKKELKNLETRRMNIITLAVIHRFSYDTVNVCILRGCYFLLLTVSFCALLPYGE